MRILLVIILISNGFRFSSSGWARVPFLVQNGAEPLPSESSPPPVQHRIDDVHRRIRNMLKQYPAASWDLEESQVVLDALSVIVRGRQSVADVIDLRHRGA